jgi:hypothetical protein
MDGLVTVSLERHAVEEYLTEKISDKKKRLLKRTPSANGKQTKHEVSKK